MGHVPVYISVPCYDIAHRTVYVSQAAQARAGCLFGILVFSWISQSRWALVGYGSAPRPLPVFPLWPQDVTYCGVGKVQSRFISDLFLCNGTAPHIFQHITHIIDSPWHDLMPAVSEPCIPFLFKTLRCTWENGALEPPKWLQGVENIAYINGTVQRLE